MVKKIIFTFVILALGIAGVITYSTAKAVSKVSTDFYAALTPFLENKENGKMDAESETSRLDEFSFIKITEDKQGNAVITVPEDELNRVLAEKIVEKDVAGFVKKASISFLDGYAELKAQVINPIQGLFTLRVRITVRNGQLYPEILKVRMGLFPIPVSVVTSFGNYVTNTKSPSEWFKTPDIEWFLVEFKHGVLTLKFKELKESL